MTKIQRREFLQKAGTLACTGTVAAAAVPLFGGSVLTGTQPESLVSEQLKLYSIISDAEIRISDSVLTRALSENPWESLPVPFSRFCDFSRPLHEDRNNGHVCKSPELSQIGEAKHFRNRLIRKLLGLPVTIYPILTETHLIDPSDQEIGKRDSGKDIGYAEKGEDIWNFSVVLFSKDAKELRDNVTHRSESKQAETYLDVWCYSSSRQLPHLLTEVECLAGYDISMFSMCPERPIVFRDTYSFIQKCRSYDTKRV